MFCVKIIKINKILPVYFPGERLSCLSQVLPIDPERLILPSLLVGFQITNWMIRKVLYTCAKIHQMSYCQEIHFYANGQHRVFERHEAEYIKKDLDLCIYKQQNI